MSNDLKLSQPEEMIFRELEALSGDFQQLSQNLVRHHKEREEQAKRIAERSGKGDLPLPMLAMNRLSLLTDLRFLCDRIKLLIDYLGQDQKPG